MSDFYNKYPYTDFHELNLDWVINSINTLKNIMRDFTASNKITFADPILHVLTVSYSKNTIVVDDIGNAYISLDIVPAGVQLSDGTYWMLVFNFEDYTERANKNLTVNYFRNIDRAPYSILANSWLVLDDILYKASVNIAADELFDPGVNIIHFTVEQFLKDFVTSINQTVIQYKNDIDASESAYRQQLAIDIANTTAALQAQFDQAISATTADSEVINARVGMDGVTYSTLRDAIVGQLTEIHNSVFNETNLLTNAKFDIGYYHDGSQHSSANYMMYYLPVISGNTYLFSMNTRYVSKSGTLIFNNSNTDKDYKWTANFSGTLFASYDKRNTFNNRFVFDITNMNQGNRWFNNLNYAPTILANKTNLLLDAELKPNSYFNGNAVQNQPEYDYFVIQVENGESYTIAAGTRIIHDGTSAITNILLLTEYVYTADYSGALYITFKKVNTPLYYVAKTTDLAQSKGAFNRFFLAQDIGDSPYAAISQAAANKISIMKNLSGKTILNVGDSIAEDRGSSERSYANQISDLTGAIVAEDTAVGGATLSLTSDQGARSSIYQQVLDTISDHPLANYDIILIDGGTNDWGQNRAVGSVVNTAGSYSETDYTAAFDVTTVIGALEEIFKLLRSNYTNSIIVFVTPHKNKLRYNAYYYQIMDGIREACYKWSIPIADIDKYGQLNTRIPAYQTTTYSDGGTHPNTLGIKMFYLPNILSKLLDFFNN